MDFLNSLDLDQTSTKSRRMRSWYLYEQYKSLEKNQIDAAERLKEKSYQEKILRQELSERKARRKLYDRFGLCHSESRIERNIKSAGAKSNLSTSSDDFFESLCELQDCNEEILSEEHDTLEDTFSFDDPTTPKLNTEDFKNYEDPNEDDSCAESVIEHLQTQNQLTVELKKKLAEEIANIEIAEEITSQLEEVKTSIQCINEFTNLKDGDKAMESREEHERTNKVVDLGSNKGDVHERDNITTMWTRLVSFAYQVTQLNHGNCYYDYSSQFLTAVLACDVLRRGVNCMCDILQPYVSPIKYATDEIVVDVPTNSYRNEKRKKSAQPKKTNKIHEYKFPTINKLKSSHKRNIDKKYNSENNWRKHSTQHTYEYRKNEKRNRISSEPWRSVAMFSTTKKEGETSSCCTSICPDFSNESNYYCNCCHKRVYNPMLKISQYIDGIMKEIDDCKQM